MKRNVGVFLFAALIALGASRGNAAVGWTFFGGSSYFNTPALGASNQPIGRVSINTNTLAGNLEGTTISLSGTRSGLSNFKLWISPDNTFGSDTQFGSTVGADPGGGTMQFSGISAQPASTTFYIFLTADVDVAGPASGSVLPSVTAVTADQLISVPGSPFNNMASGAEPLPVTLSLMTLE